VGHGLNGAEIAVVDRLVGKAVEEPPHPLLVGRPDRPETDAQPVPEDVRAGQVLGVERRRLPKVDLVRVEKVRPLRLLDQLRPVAGMGNVDQGLGPLPHRAADQRGNPVIRDDQVQRLPVGELVRIVRHGNPNVRLAPQVPARQGDQRPAPPRVLRPGKILLRLPGTARDVPPAHLQGHVARQVHLARRNHHHHPVVQADPPPVRNQVDPLKLDQRVLIEPRHELLRPLGVGGQAFPLKIALPPVGDRPAPHQVHQGVREKEGVNPQVPLPPQMPPQRLEQGAVVKGDAAPVLDHRGDLRGHPVQNPVHGPAGKIDRRLRRLHQKVELVHVDEGVAHRPGDPAVDLPHHQLGPFHGVLGRVHGHPQAGVPRGVGRRDLYERRIHPDRPRFDQPGNAGDPAGNEVHGPGRDGVAGHPAGKEGLQPEPARRGGPVGGHGIAQADQLEKLQVVEVGEARTHQAPDQRAGLRHPRAQKDAHPRLDLLENRLG